MSRLESEFQKEVLTYLKAHKIWHYRTQMGTQSGLPDIIACVHGLFVGLELKRPDGKGKLTLQQEKVIKDIKATGGFAWSISDMEQLKALLDFIEEQWSRHCG